MNIKDIIEIDVTQEDTDLANNLYEHGALPESITRGEGNFAGALGEIIFMRYFKEILTDSKATFDYDFKLSSITVDSKAKRTTVKPEAHFLCSVADYNTTQECKYYFFCRVQYDIDVKKVWLLGYIKKEDFYKEGFFAKEGEKDPEGVDWLFKANCWNTKIEKLTAFKKR